MKKNIIISLLVAFVAISSCSSTKEDDNPAPTVAELFTTAKWISVTNLEDIDLDGTFVEFGEDCEKDDVWTFSADASFAQYTGPTDCDGGPGIEALVIKGTWTLTENDTYLVLDVVSDQIKFKIFSIDENHVELGIVEFNNPPNVFTQMVILKH